MNFEKEGDTISNKAHRSLSFNLLAKEVKENDGSDDYTIREETKIKDLQIKIQILKAGVIDERKKNAELENENAKLKSRLKEMETILNAKENEIVNLSKEKFEIQSQLVIERSSNSVEKNNVPNFFDNLFEDYESAYLNLGQIKKLTGENEELKYELSILKKKHEEQSADYDGIKKEYQNLISLQQNKMKQLESTIAEKNKALSENHQRLEVMHEHFKKFDIEKTKYETQISELKKENKDYYDKVLDCLLKLEEKEIEVNHYKEAIQRHEVESAALARKLAELKNAIIEDNIVIQMFKCEKVCAFLNTAIEITFGRTEENEYVMKIKEEGSENFINIEDIEHIKQLEKQSDRVEICFMKNAKQVKFAIILEQSMVPKLLQAHKDFFKKAIASKNGILY